MTKKSKKKTSKPDVHYTVTQRSPVFSPPFPIPKTKEKIHPRQRARLGRARIKLTHRRVKRAIKGIPLERIENEPEEE